MSGLCRIVAAGDFAAERFRAACAAQPEALLIAADAGLLHLQSLDVRPDLFVGDADSLGAQPEGLACVALPTVKDDTDTLAAVREGLRRGCDRFEIYGALGGKRFSHSLANLQTLLFLKVRNAQGCLLDADCTVYALQNETATVDNACFFSLFAADGEAIVSVRNAKYDLIYHRLRPSFPLGVSNEPRGCAEITVHSGSVYLIAE